MNRGTKQHVAVKDHIPINRGLPSSPHQHQHQHHINTNTNTNTDTNTNTYTNTNTISIRKSSQFGTWCCKAPPPQK
jgi:hypothetical protein